MASTNFNNGTLIGLYLDGKKIANLTSNDITISQSLRDATTKDASGWEVVLEGLRSAEFSAEGYFREDYSNAGADEILAALVTTRTTLTALWSSEVAGDKTYSASVYVTEFSMSAPVEETQTFSASFKATGAVTISTVST